MGQTRFETKEDEAGRLLAKLIAEKGLVAAMHLIVETFPTRDDDHYQVDHYLQFLRGQFVKQPIDYEDMVALQATRC